MANGPISVSAPGTSLTTATGKDVIFNTRYPFAKLDSTNKISFQLLRILLAVDTPNPDGVIKTTNSTLIYSFTHGYNYLPAAWFMVSIDGFVTALGTEGVYLVGGGGLPFSGSAYLVAQVDTNKVNFYINKQYDTAVPGATIPNVAGVALTIRAYIFVNDLSGTDVPSQS